MEKKSLLKGEFSAGLSIIAICAGPEGLELFLRLEQIEESDIDRECANLEVGVGSLRGEAEEV